MPCAGTFTIAVTILTRTFLYTADVIVVKHFFSPTDAGLYSGVSTVARIIFYITGPVCIVLLPTVKLKNHLKENKKYLNKALLITFVLGTAALLFFLVLPSLSVKMLVGSKFVVMSPLLWKLD